MKSSMDSVHRNKGIRPCEDATIDCNHCLPESSRIVRFNGVTFEEETRHSHSGEGDPPTYLLRRKKMVTLCGRA